ncbi:hypothetical protein Kpho02_46630 [Kitasatospora phosalacinea]|uniref:Uncharacterized protein n=1 Tax=Kitasatospora phosalacinea TaxID=2065 RepID=A0A9W6V1T3_9ACTN|nr:hypothetical protein [Kitasatospora phosalacinea]GLW72364.1 hypothetical protein Kpho02_46630 [Kitasatospora phosalacinea]
MLLVALIALALVTWSITHLAAPALLASLLVLALWLTGRALHPRSRR